MADQLPSGFVPDAPAQEEDPDLAFLKPGYKRPPPAPPGFVPDDDQPIAPPDKIGAANADYAANVAALKAGQPGGAPEGGDRVAPYGLAGVVAPQTAQPAPDVSRGEALATGVAQGATLGWGDELAARADTLISKVPGVRNFVQKYESGLGSLDYTNPNLTYEQRRDAYRAYLAAANKQHPHFETAGEIGGGLATVALAPGAAADAELEAAAARAGLPAAAKVTPAGLRALEAGAKGAAYGATAGAGTSEGTTAKDVLGDTLEGGAAGAVAGPVFDVAANKVVKPLVTKAAAAAAPKLQALADKQAFQALTRKAGKAGAPESLTTALRTDPNLPAAINEPIQTAAGKTTTLAKVAGKNAAEVRPVLDAGQQKVNAGLESAFHTADAGSGGGARLADLANHYDAEIKARSGAPNNEAHIRQLEGAQADALNSWGPREEQVQGRLGELNAQTDKVYAGSDEKAPVRLGDLVDHYNAKIDAAKKSPGNEPVVAALEKARDSAVRAWGTKPVFNPEAIVQEKGPWEGAKAGDVVSKLEAMSKKTPALKAEADRIRAAATKVGYDPESQVAAKDVRKYATLLQNEGETSTQDPKLAAKARQLMGTTTKDFLNQHVENVMGPEDRKALEALNQRKTDLLRWPDVLAGKNTDPALRNRVLGEFDTRVPTGEVDKFAKQLETAGAQRMRINSLTPAAPGSAAEAKQNLGASTRDFVNRHIAASASPEDAAAYQRLSAHRKTLENLDEVLRRREGKEAENKASGGHRVAQAVGHGVGAMQLYPAIEALAHGNVGQAAAHGGAALAANAAPYVAPIASAAKRGIVRFGAGAADYLANIMTAAEAGNPWARKQIDLLRQAPGGAARLAAAAARAKGAPPAPPPAETP